MAYASTTHVEALNLGRPPLASARPGEATAGQVAEWLEETAGVIDGLLREKGYITPVPTTAPTAALKMLEGTNAIGAAFFLERSARKSDRLKEAQRMWEQAQKMISDGTAELDLPIDAEETRPRGGFGRIGAAPTPYFTRDMVLQMALTGVKFDVNGDLQYARAFDATAEEAKDLSEPLRSIGDSLLRAVHEQFRTEGTFGHGSKWKALNRPYERWKQAQVGDEPILVFTGKMRDALIAKSAVRVEPRRLTYEPDSDIAAHHQDGDGNLPTRKMVELPMTERRAWDRYFAEWLNSIRRGRLAGLAL